MTIEANPQWTQDDLEEASEKAGQLLYQLYGAARVFATSFEASVTGRRTHPQLVAADLVETVFRYKEADLLANEIHDAVCKCSKDNDVSHQSGGYV